MGPSSVLVGLVLMAAPLPEPSVQPTVDPAVAADDDVDRPQLRTPELSFLRPTTLRILGEGRLGTWSLFGSTIGASPGSAACQDALGPRCAPIAFAELGIAWRPHGSRVSLFAAAAMVSLAAMRQSMGAQVAAGLRVDLPRWLGGDAAPARR